MQASSDYLALNNLQSFHINEKIQHYLNNVKKAREIVEQKDAQIAALIEERKMHVQEQNIMENQLMTYLNGITDISLFLQNKPVYGEICNDDPISPCSVLTVRNHTNDYNVEIQQPQIQIQQPQIQQPQIQQPQLQIQQPQIQQQIQIQQSQIESQSQPENNNLTFSIIDTNNFQQSRTENIIPSLHDVQDYEIYDDIYDSLVMTPAKELSLKNTSNTGQNTIVYTMPQDKLILTASLDKSNNTSNNVSLRNDKTVVTVTPATPVNMNTVNTSVTPVISVEKKTYPYSSNTTETVHNLQKHIRQIAEQHADKEKLISVSTMRNLLRKPNDNYNVTVVTKKSPTNPSMKGLMNTNNSNSVTPNIVINSANTANNTTATATTSTTSITTNETISGQNVQKQLNTTSKINTEFKENEDYKLFTVDAIKNKLPRFHEHVIFAQTLAKSMLPINNPQEEVKYREMSDRSDTLTRSYNNLKKRVEDCENIPDIMLKIDLYLLKYLEL